MKQPDRINAKGLVRWPRGRHQCVNMLLWHTCWIHSAPISSGHVPAGKTNPPTLPRVSILIVVLVKFDAYPEAQTTWLIEIIPGEAASNLTQPGIAVF